MMKFNRLDSDQKLLLARDLKTPSLPAYLPQLDIERGYWAARYEETNGNDFEHELACSLAKELTTYASITSSIASIDKPKRLDVPEKQKHMENFLQITIGALGVSRLCRIVFSPEVRSKAIERRSSLRSQDMTYPVDRIYIEPVVAGADNLPAVRRMHVDPNYIQDIMSPIEDDACWYQGEDLHGTFYVQRTATSQPTEKFAFQMVTQGNTADFEGLHTLYPTLPAVQ